MSEWVLPDGTSPLPGLDQVRLTSVPKLISERL